MIETEANIPSPKFSNFRVSKRLMRDHRLKYLTVRALRLYLFLSLRYPKRNESDQLLFTDYEIETAVGVPRELVSLTRAELSHAKLIEYRHRKGEKKAYYKIVQDKVNVFTAKESNAD